MYELQKISMLATIPDETCEQISRACNVLEKQLGASLLAIHLYGSALLGGLKPTSDIDLLVTVNQPLELKTRQDLAQALLNISAPPKTIMCLRPLEVTLVVYNNIVPWNYPPRREYQFGEWLRNDILSGQYECAVADGDLAILLTQVRENSVSLLGRAASEIFSPVPKRDFKRALLESLDLWNVPQDWQGDERNIILTLARIWYSAVHGLIVSKDVAAEWCLQCIPNAYIPLLKAACRDYKGMYSFNPAEYQNEIAEFIAYMKSAVKDHLLCEE